LNQGVLYLDKIEIVVFLMPFKTTNLQMIAFKSFNIIFLS